MINEINLNKLVTKPKEFTNVIKAKLDVLISRKLSLLNSKKLED